MTSNIRNFKQMITPIIWLNCIFCMGIFEIPKNRPRYRISAFYVILMLTGYSILLYSKTKILQRVFTHQFMVFNIVVGISILVAALAIILFWRKSENINNIVKRNNIVDNTLEALGMNTEYPKIFRELLYFLIIWTVGIIISMFMYGIWIHGDMENLDIFCTDICLCYPVMINSVVDLTFTSFIRCIQIKFQKTNTLVNNVVLLANETNAFKIYNRDGSACSALTIANYKNHKAKIIHIIQTLRQLHLEITRIGWQINNVYSLQLLLESAAHFTIVTATTYTLYASYSGRLSTAINNEKITTIVISGCIYSIKLILMNWLCRNVSKEAYKTGEIIQSFEGSNIDDDIREEVRQFTQQLVLNSLTITAAGFFPINNFLTGKFFATVTTYVVILIQMNTFS